MSFPRWGIEELGRNPWTGADWSLALRTLRLMSINPALQELLEPRPDPSLLPTPHTSDHRPHETKEAVRLEVPVPSHPRAVVERFEAKAAGEDTIALQTPPSHRGSRIRIAGRGRGRSLCKTRQLIRPLMLL